MIKILLLPPEVAHHGHAHRRRLPIELLSALSTGAKAMPEFAKSIGKTRVQLDLSPLEIERMNWIMSACGIDQRKDLFNNALTLLEWAVGEVIDGKKVASFDDATKERWLLSMPVLNNAGMKNHAYRDGGRAPEEVSSTALPRRRQEYETID